MSIDDSFSKGGTAFAVVSPCSQCKNQLSEMSADGKPFCPRRKWIADQAAFQAANNGNSDARLAPLVMYGTEGTSKAGDKSLRNPVYVDDNKMTLVWIATLRDNAGVRDGDNNVIAPSILDPSFIPAHTDQIHCRLYPFIPAQHEAAYRQTGGLKEGDIVAAITVEEQQLSSTESVAGDNLHEYQSVPIGGIVNKVNLVYTTPRTPVGLHYIVQGT